MATFVGALVLRTAQVWEYGEGSVQAERDGKSQEHAARCMLKLGLNTCWSKTSLLRHRQMEMITTFMDNKSWCRVLSTCSSQVELPAEDVMAAVLGLLDHPQTQHQECCQALTLVSQVLRASSCSSSDQHAHSRQVIPFSKSDKPKELERSAMAVSAFPSIISRLDDSSDDVRRIAVETLATFLPFVQPDGSCREGTRPAVQKEESDASSAANDVDRSVLLLTKNAKCSVLFHLSKRETTDVVKASSVWVVFVAYSCTRSSSPNMRDILRSTEESQHNKIGVHIHDQCENEKLLQLPGIAGSIQLGRPDAAGTFGGGCLSPALVLRDDHAAWFTTTANLFLSDYAPRYHASSPKGKLFHAKHSSPPSS